MTEKSNVKPVTLLLAILVLFALAGGGIYYYFDSKNPDYTITFADGKQVTEGAGVFLAGIEVGKVVSITPSGTGVAVGIKVDRQHQANLTEASRFYIEGQGGTGRLLVKNLSANAKALEPGQVVEGTDSAFEWSAYDFAKGMNAFFESDDVRKAQEAMRSLIDDFDRQLRQTDWDALGKELERQMEELSQKLEEALNDEQVQQFQKELEKRFNEALEALDRAQNSPEAQELRRAIEDYLRKLQEEMVSPDDPVQKTSL